MYRMPPLHPVSGTPPQGQHGMYNGGGMSGSPHMRMRMPGPAPVRYPPGVIPHPHHMQQHHIRPGMPGHHPPPRMNM